MWIWTGMLVNYAIFPDLGWLIALLREIKRSWRVSIFIWASSCLERFLHHQLHTAKYFLGGVFPGHEKGQRLSEEPMCGTRSTKVVWSGAVPHWATLPFLCWGGAVTCNEGESCLSPSLSPSSPFLVSDTVTWWMIKKDGKTEGIP